MTTEAETRNPEEAGGLRRELRFWEAIALSLRFLFVAARRAPRWQVVVPLIAIAFLGFTIYKNIEGTSFPYDRFPFVVGAWLVVGAAIIVAFPGLARSIGASLAQREGLTQES